MSKFFDPRTRQVHSVASYAGAVKIPKEIVEASIKLDESPYRLAPAPLRRSNACTDLANVPSFFSSRELSIVTGNFCLSSSSNSDLTPVASTIIYR
jgi:hypothetical protein